MEMGQMLGKINFWKRNRCCLVKMTVFHKMEVGMMKVKRKVLKIIHYEGGMIFFKKLKWE